MFQIRHNVQPVEQMQGEYGPSPHQMVRDQVAEYEASRGTANLSPRAKLPIVVFTLRGHRTGKIRKVAVMRVEHDGGYALVGSRGGAATHPAWYYSLKANPTAVLLQDGPEPFPVDVRELDGAERAIWWERAVAAYPPYAEYQQRTSRKIPVFLATRREPDHS
jgi:deazaflavin-dependent oxidoreductase (nitroreductase family)